MPNERFAGFQLVRGGHLLLKSVISLFDPVLELAILLLLVDLLKVLALDLLFKPGDSHFLTLELPLSLFYLLLGFSNLAQVPLHDLQTIFVYLGILCSPAKTADVQILRGIIGDCASHHVVGSVIVALEHTHVGQGHRIDGKVRHQAQVVQLANLSFRFDLHYLVIDTLFMGLHLGQLGPQLLSFLRGTVLQLFIEQVFKPTILGSHLLGDT